MELNKLFLEKPNIIKHPEKTFVPLSINIGIEHPILFIPDRSRVNNATYFNLDTVEERNYTINVVSSNGFVILYVINIKAPYFSILNNGLLIRNRKKWDDKADTEGVATRYTFEDFVVVSNKNQSSEIFCRSIASEQKT